jgi:hypothetical protein
LLVAEIGVTLLDFVQEDRSRVLPATERVLQTILAVNYGAFLALLVPQLALWSAAPPTSSGSTAAPGPG